jgi:hypothetical protein
LGLNHHKNAIVNRRESCQTPSSPKPGNQIRRKKSCKRKKREPENPPQTPSAAPKLNHHHLRFPRGKQNTNTVRQIQEEKRRRKQKQKATGTGEDEIRRRSGLVVRRLTPPSSHHHLLHVYIARGKFGLKGRSMQI